MSDFKMRELLSLLKMSQSEVKTYVAKQLRKHGYKPVVADGFIYAEGTTPIGLVAHMDTVCMKAPRWIHNDNGVLSNANKNDCLGADDRAGIYSILHLLRGGHRPTVIITEDEEVGCIGASKFASVGIEADLCYLIELDRKGDKDAVYYECFNPDFEAYIHSFGFKKAFGSYSDITQIAPELGVCAVNLSIGYYNQHTSWETLVISDMLRTISRVEDMLYECTGEIFEWGEFDYSDYYPKQNYTANTTYYSTSMKDLAEEYNELFQEEEEKHVTSFIDLQVVPVVECWLNYTVPDYDFVEADGAELLFIGNDDVVYDASGEKANVILFNDSYEQLFYEDMVKINHKLANANRRF